MYLGQSHATTVGFELLSLMLEFRAYLDGLAGESAGMPDPVLQRVKDELRAAKEFLEGVLGESGSNSRGAEMFSLLIRVENPTDWNAFRAIIDTRLMQIDRLSEETKAVEELKAWADRILEALQQSRRMEVLKDRTRWSP